jgi:hypothetical protein
MAIGANQKPLHELTKLLGPQPAEYRGTNNWGEARERGSGARRLRADRQRAGLHPVGVAPLDAAKARAGHTCLSCKWRVASTGGTRFYVCSLAMRRIDRRRGYGGKRAFQVKLKDPPCTLHEDSGIWNVTPTAGDKDDATRES